MPKQKNAVLELLDQTWTRSVPPRGSGWVPRSVFGRAYGVLTRYREVVLTVPKLVQEFLKQW